MSVVDKWATDTPGYATDWFEFTLPGRPDVEGEDIRVYRVNVSFMLSTWKCMYGTCPGILISGARTDQACCQIGVHMEKGAKDFKRVKGYVEQLTEEDLDEEALELVRKGEWYYKIPKDDTDESKWSYETGLTRHTVVREGACIFANQHGGSAGKPGCALHVLADRLGLHHSETKPDICWQIPFGQSEEYNEDSLATIFTIDGTPAHTWGHTDPSDLETVGFWCTETPDAYIHDTSAVVFRANKTELVKIMGADAYNMMAMGLENIAKTGGRRFKMPGELTNEGRPLLPLLVKQRADRWAEEAVKPNESMEALQRSMSYIETLAQGTEDSEVARKDDDTEAA